MLKFVGHLEILELSTDLVQNQYSGGEGGAELKS